MTNDQLTALLGAIALVLTGLAAVLAQLVALTRKVDGRLTQLLEITSKGAGAEGELRGRDFAAGPVPPDVKS